MADAADFYQAFAQVLRGGDDALMTPYLADGQARARLVIHKSNFAMTATKAMQGIYKAVARLVGDEYFAALVRAFMDEAPPHMATLTRYGDGFAAFLRRFAPVQKDLPWLAPVAELDWAWFRAYGAADRPALDPAALQDVPPHVLPSLAPGLHGSATLLRFSVPAWSIWRTNVEDEMVQQVPLSRGREWALIWRQGLQVRHASLNQAEYVFLDAVGGGRALAEAWIDAQKHDPGFDLAKHFARWLNAGVFKGEHHV